MNRDPYIPYRPFKRESGVLARADENGDELRVHSDDSGRFHPFRWQVDPTSHDGWRGAVPFGFTPADIAAMAAATA